MPAKRGKKFLRNQLLKCPHQINSSNRHKICVNKPDWQNQVGIIYTAFFELAQFQYYQFYYFSSQGYLGNIGKN